MEGSRTDRNIQPGQVEPLIISQSLAAREEFRAATKLLEVVY